MNHEAHVALIDSHPERDGSHDQQVESARAFEELSKLVLGEESLTAVLQRVAQLARSVVHDARDVSVTLLKDTPNPSEREIREGISGNYCRCTGYQHIVNAIQYAAANA